MNLKQIKEYVTGVRSGFTWQALRKGIGVNDDEEVAGQPLNLTRLQAITVEFQKIKTQKDRGKSRMGEITQVHTCFFMQNMFVFAVDD